MFTVMNHFTKWAEDYPHCNHKALTVAKIHVEQLFIKCGMPYKLFNEQCSEFGSDIFF